MAKLAEPVRVEHGQVACLRSKRLSWASLATWRHFQLTDDRFAELG
jgi:hypothetical protein